MMPRAFDTSDKDEGGAVGASSALAIPNGRPVRAATQGRSVSQSSGASSSSAGEASGETGDIGTVPDQSRPRPGE